ncbi:hypothetical protein ON010_g5866 [Phytophthora cinnamomi]|nr:hypothetical protein ON010_g5866 [Phytophthora cinnamomi]
MVRSENDQGALVHFKFFPLRVRTIDTLLDKTTALSSGHGELDMQRGRTTLRVHRKFAVAVSPQRIATRPSASFSPEQGSLQRPVVYGTCLLSPREDERSSSSNETPKRTGGPSRSCGAPGGGKERAAPSARNGPPLDDATTEVSMSCSLTSDVAQLDSVRLKRHRQSPRHAQW